MLADKISEVIFIGVPGPTHHYGGHSGDNVASSTNKGSVSSPRQAALQALELARTLKAKGITTGLFMPQLRPHLPLLAERFPNVESAEALITIAGKDLPKLLQTASSSSAMWAANAATVTTPVDAADGKLHLTVANLFSNPHRRIEAEETHRLLAAIFKHVPDTVVHPPLVDMLRDEGAANHMRLAPAHDKPGLNVMVYGADGSDGDLESARQMLAASEVIAMEHTMEASTLYVKQNPAAIQVGVFHNDVIAVGNEYVLLVHEEAYANGAKDIVRIEEAYAALTGQKLITLTIRSRDLTVGEAVTSYLFNSQIVTKPGGKMMIIAPTEVREVENGRAVAVLENIVADNTNPIDEMLILDLRQSMRNGGGPACLRLRVPMTAAQQTALATTTNVLVTDDLLYAMTNLIERYYPLELTAAGLADPALYRHGLELHHELAQLMKLAL